MRRRVAIVSWSLYPTGYPGTGLAANIIKAGQDRFDFVAVTGSVHPELMPLVEWRRAPAPRRHLRLLWAIFYVTAGLALLRTRADVVHVFSPMPTVPNRADLATINWCHAGYHEAAAGRPPGESRLTWRAARAFILGLERFTYRPKRTRMAEAETAAAKATIERHYPELPVVEIPLVYDTGLYRPDPVARRETRARHGVEEDDVVALFVGTNWNAKGLDLAVAGGEDAGRIERTARRHGVQGRVTLLGLRSDLERYFPAADVFVLPTLYEHGSRASHEAAACGLPLAVTATHGPAELIGDDQGGIVIQRDPASIGAALARLAADPELRRSMGDTARERMLSTNGTSYEPYLELYDRLAERNGA